MFAMSLPAPVVSPRLPIIRAPEGYVSVAEQYRPLPATIAYNAVIAEAAALYDLIQI